MNKPSNDIPLTTSVTCCVDAEIGRRALTCLRLVAPQRPTGKSKIRLGRANDGGYVMIDQGLDAIPAYSLGIGDDVSWDLAMAQRGCTLFQYDGTIRDLPVSHKAFQFESLNLVGKDPTCEKEITLAGLLARNGHSQRRDLVLKIDIEDSEWSVFDSAPDEVLDCFSQIVVEFHCLNRLDYTPRYEQTVRCLKKLAQRHQPVHLHANNYGGIAFLGGVVIPETIEVTYLRKAGQNFERCTDLYPLDIDQPNKANTPDIFLGAVGMLA